MASQDMPKHGRDQTNESSRCSLLINFLIFTSLIIFAIGFFPYKAFLPGHASFTADEVLLAQNAPFDKVILMVVDALRRSGIFLPLKLPWLRRSVTLSSRVIQASNSLKSTRFE